MKKPESLRRFLEANIRQLKKHPDRLHVYIDNGAIATKPGASYSFEWRYKLTLLFTDFVDSPDTIVLPLLRWICVNQPDIIADAEGRYRTLSFRSEVINHAAIDIEFELELSERVIVTETEAGYDCEHADEPLPPELDGVVGWTLYVAGEEFPPPPR